MGLAGMSHPEGEVVNHDDRLFLPIPLSLLLGTNFKKKAGHCCPALNTLLTFVVCVVT